MVPIVFSKKKSSVDIVVKSVEDGLSTLYVTDTMSGFDSDYQNYALATLNDIGKKITVVYDWPLQSHVKRIYQNLNLKFQLYEHSLNAYAIRQLESYNIHPQIDFKNFICSFNGFGSVDRHLLVSILYKLKWYNKKYCSKNFVTTYDQVDGHFLNLLDGVDQQIYRKFFVDDTDAYRDFLGEAHSFSYDQLALDFQANAKMFENKITSSFVNIVSESATTSYHPYPTEKYLYNIVMRSLFITYGQVGWYDYVEKYYGFKKYNKIFDYHFDTISNPVKRLVEITSMLSKFSMLSIADWTDLYQIELDTIEYNYDHYMSGRYYKQLESFTDY